MSQFREGLSYIPEHMQEGMVDYITRGLRPGGFLSAVLSNDLMGALEKADYLNSTRIRQYGYYLFNYAPMGCYGSVENFNNWIKRGGLEGFAKEGGYDASST